MARGASESPPRTREWQCRKCGGTERHRDGRCRRCRNAARTRAFREARRRDPALVLLSGARARSRESGAEFSLTLQDIRAVWPADNRCPALGIELKPNTGGGAHDASPALDRIDPRRGYVPGNIAVISFAANRAKNNLRAEDLEAIARWLRATSPYKEETET